MYFVGRKVEVVEVVEVVKVVKVVKVVEVVEVVEILEVVEGESARESVYTREVRLLARRLADGLVELGVRRVGGGLLVAFGRREREEWHQQQDGASPFGMIPDTVVVWAAIGALASCWPEWRPKVSPSAGLGEAAGTAPAGLRHAFLRLQRTGQAARW